MTLFLIPSVLSTGCPQPSVLSPISVSGQTFQIATFKETTVSEIAEKTKFLAERGNGKKVEIIHAEERPGDVKRNYSDISKARAVLGFKPEYNLHTGLHETWKAFRLSHLE